MGEQSRSSSNFTIAKGTDVTSEATAVSFSGTETIEDTVLVDEKDVRITADNLTCSAYQTTMDLLIEKNSDQALSVISGSIGFQVKTSDYQDYLTTDPVKIKTSAAISYDLSEDTYQKAISDGTFEAVSGKKITAFQTGEYFSSGGIRLVSAGLVSNGDTKATLLELENIGAMKYGISKSSSEDNKIGTDDITTVSFQLNIDSRSFYNYIDQPKLTISYN